MRRAQERDQRPNGQHAKVDDRQEDGGSRNTSGSQTKGKKHERAPAKAHRERSTTTKRKPKPYTVRYLTADAWDRTEGPTPE